MQFRVLATVLLLTVLCWALLFSPGGPEQGADSGSAGGAPATPGFLVDSPPRHTPAAFESPAADGVPQGAPDAATDATDEGAKSPKETPTAEVADHRSLGGCRGCVFAFGSEPPVLEQVTPATEEASEKVVVYSGQADWGTRHQGTDGRWGTALPEGCACESFGGHDLGDPRVDVERTSLMLLTYTSSGHTHRFGRHKRTVDRALKWLRSVQDPRGWFGPPLDAQSSARNHVLATYALADLLAVSQDFRLRNPLQAALRVCERDLLPNLEAQPDAAVGWLMLALLTAAEAGVEVEPEHLALLHDRVSLEATDTLGLAVALHYAVRLDDRDRLDPRVLAAAKRLASSITPAWEPGQVDLEVWFFTATVLRRIGGAPWAGWRTVLDAALLENQRAGGCTDGSWDPIGRHGAGGGRAWSYAMASLCLEVGYRDDRSYPPSPKGDEPPPPLPQAE